MGYFTSKLVFSKNTALAPLQILNQIIIFALLFFIFWLFASLDDKLENMPKWLRNIFHYLASITLEIYLVQYELIGLLKQYFAFPVNWVIITTSILVCATALHYTCKFIYWAVDKIIENIKYRLKEKKEEM